MCIEGEHVLKLLHMHIVLYFKIKERFFFNNMFKLEEIYFVLNLMSNMFSNVTSPLSCLAPATFVYLPQTMAYSFCSCFFLLNVF